MGFTNIPSIKSARPSIVLTVTFIGFSQKKYFMCFRIMCVVPLSSIQISLALILVDVSFIISICEASKKN